MGNEKTVWLGLFLKGINLTLFEFLFLGGECSMLLAHSN
jgi:hypothetical protein